MLLTTCVLLRARARRAFRETRETIGDVTANLQEEIVGVREAQAFNRTERQHRALPPAQRRQPRRQRRGGRRDHRLHPGDRHPVARWRRRW